MRPAKAFPPNTAERMKQLLRQSKSVADQRRIQAVLMRALDASPPERIAAITGLSRNTVRIIHSRFLREGEGFLLERPGRGGRRHSHLSQEQAAELLARHITAADQGRMVEATAFKREYERLVGHPVAASTVYRFLERAGWRKVIPRPRHPKQDPQAQETLKKTLPPF